MKKQRDDNFESFLDEINEKMQTFEEESTKEYILNQLATKFNLRKDMEKVEIEFKDLMSFFSYFQNHCAELGKKIKNNFGHHSILLIL